MDDIWDHIDAGMFTARRTPSGLFDPESLVAIYSFSYADYVSNNYTESDFRTWVHEFTHLLQTLGTTYGFYNSCLRRLQYEDTIALIRALHEEGFGLRPNVSLRRLVRELNRHRYALIHTCLDSWHVIEVLRHWFEGDTDTFIGLSTHPVVGGLSERQMFIYVEERLVSYFRSSDADLQYAGPSLSDNLRVEAFEELSFDILRSDGVDVSYLIESWARMSERFSQLCDGFSPVPSEVSADLAPYVFLNTIGSKRWKSRENYVSEYIAICDLCASSPLLPHNASLRNSALAMSDLHPITRFLKAGPILGRLPPLASQRDYEAFIQEACDILKWPTPMQIAENICSQFHPFANNVRQIAFLKHQQRRKVAPWAMVSLCHNDIRFIRTNLNIFAPSVTEFKDQTRYHPDRKFMDYFLIHYYMDVLLRKIVLDGNLDVGLPIRTMPNQLIYYARSIFEWFNARTGVEPPHFILLSANDRVESTAL